jgi:lipid-A-disaccharide synthase
MLEVSKAFPEYEFVVAKAPGLEDSFYEPFLAPYKKSQHQAEKLMIF